MKRIGILSDTHGSLPEGTAEFFAGSDEIWHAGDVGATRVLDEMQNISQVRAVYGNIDGTGVRMRCPETQVFMCEGLKVLIIHIGGYPKRYTPQVKELIEREKPDIVVTGHSHILKVIYDKENAHLHINPGAAGRSGLHGVRTMIRLVIDGKDIRDLEVREMPRGGA